MHGIEDLLVHWRKFRADTLTRWLYRIRTTVEGNRLVNIYQTALVSAVRDIRVPGRAEPLDIEGIYISLRVAKYSHQRMASTGQEAEQGDQVPAHALPVEDALRGSPHMVLLGEPGSGKSTTLKALAFRFMQEEVPADYVRQLTLGLQDKPLERLLPIIVSLPGFARSDMDLLAHLTEVFAAHQVPYPHLFLTDRLERGECVLLMDDLDKIAEKEQRARVTAEIQHLTKQYPFNPVIVTSRRDDDQGLSPRFRRWWVLGLDDAGIDDLGARWYGGQPAHAQALRRTMDRNQGLRSLAANPLFLSVLLVVYESDQEKPARCAALYEGLLRILLDQDETSPFEPALKKLVLQELALELHTRRARSLEKGELLDRMQAILSRSGHTADRVDQLLNELVIANILWPGVEGKYGFAHLALQEYLAARAVFERSDLETIAGHVDDPWYEEVFVLLAGLRGEAHELIRLIRECSQNPQQALFLAARCLAAQPVGTLKENIRKDLFELFRKESPELWEEAAASIAGIEDTSVEGALIGFLKAQNPELRQNAAWALGRIGKEWAVTPLINALEDPRPGVRKRAAWALGQIRDERAIHPLIRVFDDQDQGVAEEAAQAAAAIGRPVVEPLIRSLSVSEEQVRRVAMIALGQIGAPAVSLLIEALGDERQKVREGVKLALIRIGEPGVEQLVEAFAKAKGDLVQEIVDVLVEICDPRVVKSMINALPDARGEMSQALKKALVMCGEPALDELIETLLDMDFREVAMDALAAFEGLATAKLSIALKDERWEMRWRAAQALGELRHTEALELLIGVLQDSRREVRRAAVDSLRKIGDMRAVAPLIKALSSDEDDGVRWEAAKALGELRDDQAIPSLLQALSDRSEAVRQNALLALVETGTSVVEPLIDTLYERGGRSSTALEYAIEVLENIGTIYATKDTAQAKLAAAYSKLLKGNYGAQEILSSLHELGWWKRSAELQQLFQVFHSLVSGQRLDEFTVEQNDLVRLSQTVRWLGRSRLREWLRESSQILGDVQWYRTSAIEKNRQDALLRMGIRVRRLRQLTAGIADPELTILRQIVEHWQQLIAEATARTGTRADLELELLVDQLRLAKPQPHVVLAKLANTGNAPATNVTAALLPAREGEFRIIEGTKEYPHEIEARGHRTLEFALEPLRSGSVELSFEVRYDDINRAGHSKLVSGGRVHFLSEVPTYKPIPYDANPYITGAPVRTRNMFYGREDILDWVRSNLSGTYQQNILVLHGQRRTGKTSVLHQLRLSPPTEHHIFVLFDMELAAPKTTGDFFLELAERVHAELTGAGIAMAPPHKDEYESYPERQFRSFCSQLEALLHDRYVVIMIDEFDKLIGKVNEGLLDKDIYDTLRGLMQSSVKVNFLFTGAHEVTKMLGDPTSRLFRMTKPKRIGLLNLNEAEELIRKPVRGLIDYHSLAVSKILRVTAGHPYLIQYICHSLVNLARRKERNYIDLIDVNEVLATKLEEIVVNISTDYEELSEAERRVLAALAYAGDEWRFVSKREIETVLAGYSLPVAELEKSLETLKQRDFIQEKRVGQEYCYQFSVELLRLWLQRSDMLLKLQ